MKEMHYEAGTNSQTGDRKQNQDRCTLVESSGGVLLALGDGMGGHPKGEVAAQILIETSEEMFLKARKPISDPQVFLSELLNRSHKQIVDFGNTQVPSITPRTTAVVALVQNDLAYWAHLGDSRLYLLRNGQPHLRTVDHSYVELLRQQGAISENACEKHPHRNYVTRCLGGKPDIADISFGTPVPLRAGDTLLLCSDGLWSNLQDDIMAKAMLSTRKLSVILNALVKEAQSVGRPSCDNVSVAALRWQKGEHQATGQKQATPAPSATDTGGELTEAIDHLTQTIDLFTKTEEEHQ